MTNIAFQNEYLAMLNRVISGSGATYGKILDARDEAEMKGQEESVEATLQRAVIIENN